MRFRWDIGLGKELGLVFWSLTLFEAAYGTWATIWPLWIEHLGAGIGTVGIVLSLGGFLRPIILLGGSWLSDRVNVRWMLVIARSTMVTGVVFAAFARSWEYLLITVFLIGFGELVFPALHAHIPVHAGENIGRAFSITCTIGPSFALLVTPLIASVVIDAFGMKGGILFAASLSAIGTLFLAQMNFSKDREFAQDAEPGSIRDLVRHADTRDIVIIHALTVLSLGVGGMLLPNFLQDIRGLSPAVITMLSAGSALGTLAFGWAGLRIKFMAREPFLAAIWSVSVTALGYGLFAVSPWIPAIAIAYICRGGFFATWQFLIATIGQYAPQRLQTRAFAMVEVLGGTALSFSPLIAAGLYGWNAFLPFIASVLGCVMMCGVIAWRYRRGLGESTPNSEPVTVVP